MVSQVGAPAQARGQGRYKQRHLHTRCFEPPEAGAAPHIKADAINQQAHAHTIACASNQAGCDFITQRVTPQEETAHVQPLRGTVDEGPDRLQGLHAILVNIKPVETGCFGKANGVRKPARLGGELGDKFALTCRRVPRGQGADDPPGCHQLSPAKHQIQWQRDVRDEHQHDDPRNGG